MLSKKDSRGWPSERVKAAGARMSGDGSRGGSLNGVLGEGRESPTTGGGKPRTQAGLMRTIGRCGLGRATSLKPALSYIDLAPTACNVGGTRITIRFALTVLKW